MLRDHALCRNKLSSLTDCSGGLAKTFSITVLTLETKQFMTYLQGILQAERAQDKAVVMIVEPSDLVVGDAGIRSRFSDRGRHEQAFK